MSLWKRGNCVSILTPVPRAQNNPLHISIFPSHDPATNTLKPIRTPLQFSLLLSSTLDIFDLRAKQTSATVGAGAPLSGDYGLLHAVDERLAAYGFETNTGVKFVVVVDMRGRRIDSAALPPLRQASEGAGGDNSGFSRSLAAVVGLREGDMKVVFRAIQSAYVRLLQNPFYEPDEHSSQGGGGRRITSKKFEGDMRKIGESWTVGVTSL